MSIFSFSGYILGSLMGVIFLLGSVGMLSLSTQLQEGKYPINRFLAFGIGLFIISMLIFYTVYKTTVKYGI